ncbi:MAG: CHC2 zinc finger domain-containing protein [Pseudomonadota bacterium]
MKLTPDQIQAIKDANPIEDVVGRFVEWDMRKSIPNKRDYWACCPFHGEKTPSFHVSSNRYYCFGCGASGDVIKFLVEYKGISFWQALNDLGGVEIDMSPEAQQKREESKAYFQRKRKIDQQRKEDQVQKLWRECRSIPGTFAEAYLLGRGYDFPKWPWSFRFHPECYHSVTKECHPALVCAMMKPSKPGVVVAVQRIYLKGDGNLLIDGKKSKRVLGNAEGAACWFDKPTDRVLISEGVETGCAVKHLTEFRTPVAAAISTSGLLGFEFPERTTDAAIYLDMDRRKFKPMDPQQLGPSAGLEAAKRLREIGMGMHINMSLQRPPNGMDWDDVWQKVRGLIEHV